MHRNLDRRVEALVQVTDPAAGQELDTRSWRCAMSDECEAFDLAGDGTWTRRVATDDRPLTHLQDALLQRVVGGLREPRGRTCDSRSSVRRPVVRLTAMLEEERKYDVEPGFALPDLDALRCPPAARVLECRR